MLHRIPLLAWVLLGVGLLALPACSDHIAGVHKSFDQNGWAFADSVALDFEIMGEYEPLDLVLGLELDAERYPYRNVYLQFALQGPYDSTQIALQNAILGDEAGNWYVEPNWQGNLVFQKTLVSGAQFPKSGPYRLTVSQYMRHDTLAGVRKVSLYLRPHVPENAPAPAERPKTDGPPAEL